MSQCVPRWDLDDSPPARLLRSRSHSNIAPHDVPALLDYEVANLPKKDYEVAELTWANGKIAMHCLGPPRVPNKPLINATSATTNSHACKYNPPTATTVWEKPRAGGTLESIVNQATRPSFPRKPSSSSVDELVPWFNHDHNAAANAVTDNMDAQVPCSNRPHHHQNDVVSCRPVSRTGGGAVNFGSLYTQVTSCGSAATRDENNNAAGQQMKRARVAERVPPEWSVSGTSGSQQVRMDQYSCERRDFGVGFMTSTSLGSPENASSGKPSTKAASATATATAADDHDSVCHSRPQASDHTERKRVKY